MPIYNGIEFIEQSVSSILNQTYEEWELLIGINGYSANSTTLQKAQQLYKNNPKIRILDLGITLGKANALNILISYCKYDWIALLDVDDLWHPTKLMIQMYYAINGYIPNNTNMSVNNTNNTNNKIFLDVIGSQCIYFGDKSGSPNIPTGYISNFNIKLFNPIVNSSVIFKKKYAFWIENGIEDYELWIRLWKQKCHIFNCNRILVAHRIHAASAFNSKGHSTLKKDLLNNI